MDMDIQKILSLLPHRYPFLMVDRILELVEDEYAVCIKNVTINEPCFQGHFPAEPIFPGVLILEALAQVAGIVALGKYGNEKKAVYLAKIEEAKFIQKVVPGDTLFLTARKEFVKMGLYAFETFAKVNEKIVVKAKIFASLG